METFESISWNIPAELSTDFASIEEFKSTSFTYKILHGTIKADLSSDSSDEPLPEKNETSKKVKKKKKVKGNKKTSDKTKKKETLNTAEHSVLKQDGVQCSAFTTKQHAAFVNMLLSTQNQKTSIPSEWIEMKQAVEKEQLEFLEHIKKLWKTSYEKHHVLGQDAKKFVADQWKSKLMRVKNYPQFYTPIRKIALVYPTDKPEIQMVPLQMLLEKGVVPRFLVPNYSVSAKISTDYSSMLLMSTPSPDDVNTLLHLPVSCDKNAEILAVKERADIVISSSSLKCIADNISSKFDKVWNIPCEVKQYVIKDDITLKPHKVVYIDKNLPPKSMNTHERNSWFHKKAVKCLMCNHRDPGAFRYPDNQNLDLNIEFSNEKSITEPQNDLHCTVNNCNKCKLSRKESNENDFNDDSSDCGDLVINNDAEDSLPGKTCSCKNASTIQKDISPSIENNTEHIIIPPPSKTNITYRLWKLNCEERCKEELNKKFLKGQNAPKELRVLVRCKIDACEHENNQVLPVCISCKLEYQAEYGAEKVNLSSLVREWVSLFFRPEAILRRIRIDAMTDEILMTEMVRLCDLSLMAFHLYDFPIRKYVLGSFYQVMVDLLTLNPGRYLLSHDVQNGPFTSVLQETHMYSDYNLHADFQSVKPEVINEEDSPQWIPIDTNLVTKKHIASKRIPATFQPSK